ncbi:hypothetical protein [Clostridium amazonitimonense]|uniref:hypothetical protein n=1 Tax=Clostridium amazonitimonense TaxID=1499689 RepID=UPI0005094336|nr:hypothetical protein [Clostridium amazonitimonense]
MCKIIKSLISIFVILLFYNKTAFAKDYTSINDLVEKSKEFDKTTVLVKGEAIGETMKRGDYSWININDGSNAIGIWGESDVIKEASTFGNYKSTGDMVEVLGEFHRECSEHGGDVDIHLKDFKVLEKGKARESYLNKKKVNISIILTICTGILGFNYYKIRKKV